MASASLKSMRYMLFFICVPLMGCSHNPDPKLAAFRLAAAELPKTLDELKQAGLSTSWDSLDRNVPDSQNGAAAYKLAFAMADMPGVIKPPLGGPDGSLPPNVEAILKSNYKTLAQLRRAAGYKHCHFGNIRSGARPIPYFELMLKGARLLALDAMYQVQKVIGKAFSRT